MSARDATFADARARLVPWLPEGALREHARTALAGTEQESRLVALRAVELREAEIWSQMLTLSTATTEVLAAARDALGSLDEDACNAVTNALLDDVEKVLVPPPVLEHVEG